MVWFGREFFNWFDLGGCDCKSVVVGLLFMVLVCGGGLCDDGGKVVVLVSQRVDLWVVVVFFLLGAI